MGSCAKVTNTPNRIKPQVPASWAKYPIRRNAFLVSVLCMKTSNVLGLSLSLFAGLVFSGCVVHSRGPRVVYTDSAPPAAPVAAVVTAVPTVTTVPSQPVVVTPAPTTPVVVTPVATPAPGPDYVWIEGAWLWRDGRWDWEAAHWARRPFAGAVWVPSSYEYMDGRHTFRRGYWR